MALPLKDIFFCGYPKGSRKKVLFFSGPATKMGGGEGKGPATKEKGTFKKPFFLICSRWKIKYILFKSTYANINISV